jgi:hypothetical protein
VRNALADLERPAPPVAVQVTVRRRTATIRVRGHGDPRVQRYEVFRRAGAAAFEPDDRGVVRVCRTSGRACTQRRLRPGTYRFAAVGLDEWGRSTSTLSRKVVIRRGGR